MLNASYYDHKKIIIHNSETKDKYIALNISDSRLLSSAISKYFSSNSKFRTIINLNNYEGFRFINSRKLATCQVNLKWKNKIIIGSCIILRFTGVFFNEVDRRPQLIYIPKLICNKEGLWFKRIDFPYTFSPNLNILYNIREGFRLINT